MAEANRKIVFTLLFIPFVIAFPDYAKYIPNGHRIPDPCDRTRVWDALGHINSLGSGPTTPFGDDFAGVWDEAICQRDSDGDGKTNGQELGDPRCVWKRGEKPDISSPEKLTHPGICEPLDSPYCKGKNNFLSKECLDRFPTKYNSEL